MAGLSNRQAAELIRRIDQFPALRGLGVGFIGLGMCQQLRSPTMPSGLQTWIILKEVTAEDTQSTGGSISSKSRVQRESNIGFELLQMGLSCSAATLAGIVATGGVAAAPVTAGTSTAISVVAWAGAVATAAQCGISSGRVFNEIFNPAQNDYLDSESWYQVTSNTLDAISIAGGLASLGQAAQAAIRLSRSSGKPIQQVLKGLSRNERKRLAQDLAKYSGQASTRKQFIRLARQGKIPKIIRQQAINKAIVNEMLNSIGAGLTMIGSGTSGLMHGLVVYFVEDE